MCGYCCLNGELCDRNRGRQTSRPTRRGNWIKTLMMAELVLERQSVRLLGRICLVHWGCLGGVCKVCSFEYPHLNVLRPKLTMQYRRHGYTRKSICIGLSTPTVNQRSYITILYTPKSQCESKNSNEVNACLHIMSERKPTPTDISGKDHFSSILRFEIATRPNYGIFLQKKQRLCAIFLHSYTTVAIRIQGGLQRSVSSLIVINLARLSPIW